ncbi:MAG: ribonuclease E activity regulator RraA [Methylovulum sp.]|nr:ribonuclease E activity regulator RraA [Methylovulum sp.]
MTFTTAALCDAHSAEIDLQIAEPIFKSYGANPVFCGHISTLKVFENDELLAQALAEKVENRVLVVDGGGSHHCAILNGEMAKTALENGWQGLVIYGCIRDSAAIDQLPIGIRALHTHPLKCPKKVNGDRDVLVSFAGVNFRKDYYLYADADGIIVFKNSPS